METIHLYKSSNQSVVCGPLSIPRELQPTLWEMLIYTDVLFYYAEQK